MLYRVKLIVVVTVVLGFSCALIPTAGFSQTPYYQGKTITIVRGGEPGGSGDMQASAHPLLEKYISGNPTIVIENMPGAAGMKAVNHAYSTAKPDGLTITAVGSGLASGAILGLPGVRYDIDKLIYLGSTEHGDPYVFLSRKERVSTPWKIARRLGSQGRGANRGPCGLHQRTDICLSTALKIPGSSSALAAWKWMPP